MNPERRTTVNEQEQAQQPARITLSKLRLIIGVLLSIMISTLSVIWYGAIFIGFLSITPWKIVVLVISFIAIVILLKLYSWPIKAVKRFLLFLKNRWKGSIIYVKWTIVAIPVTVFLQIVIPILYKGKTLLDILVPAAILIIGTVFTRRQKESELVREDKRDQDEILDEYIEYVERKTTEPSFLTNPLLQRGLQIKTDRVLSKLKSENKHLVLRLLTMNSLINHDNEIVHLDGRDFSHGDYQVPIYGESLIDLNLSGAKFRYADFRQQNLTRVNLSHCDLSHADFRKAILNEVNLENANLENANLFGATYDLESLKRAKSLKHTTLRSGYVNKGITLDDGAIL